MKKTKEIQCIILIFCITISLFVPYNVKAANINSKPALANSSNNVTGVARRNMIKKGNYFYIKTPKGFMIYNYKTNKSRYIVRNNDLQYGGFLVYDGYIYYTSKNSIYRVKTSGNARPVMLCKNGSIGFVKNRRIYYGVDGKGLYSMNLDGKKKKQLAKVPKGMNCSYVFAYNSSYFFGDPESMYSVNAKFGNRKKVNEPYQMIIKALNYTISSSSVEMNNNAQCWVENNYKNGKNRIIYRTSSKKKCIYTTKCDRLTIVASCADGYLLISEAGESVDWDDIYQKGTVRLIKINGKTIKVFKNKQK